jgi:hypothetical protein
MTAVPRGYRATRVLGVVLGVANVVLWLAAPAIRDSADSALGRLNVPGRPGFVYGVHELVVYFDPWLARGVFGVVYTVGLAAIPFLRKPVPNPPGSAAGWPYTLVVTALLLAFEAIWLLLFAIGIFLRGPNWNLYWPGEAYVPKMVPLSNVNLSRLFWVDLLGTGPDGFKPRYGVIAGALLRESPGIILLLTYFLAGLVLARFLARVSRHTTAYWRWAALVLLVQLAALVPAKVLPYWWFHLKYWIYVPEFSFCV